jgi:hypothetical protein
MSLATDDDRIGDAAVDTQGWVRPTGFDPARGAPVGWTRVGTLDGVAEPIVDERGAVQAAPGLPVVDWWIAGDDRWYFPSQETTVRQSLVTGTPVVETRMRVKGGDMCHRVYAMTRSSEEGGGDALVIEVENLAAVPCGVAFAVRPFGVDLPVPIHDVRLDGTVLRADGRPMLVLPRAPGGSLAGAGEDGDLAVRVARGEAVLPTFEAVTSPAGLGQAVVVLPIAHATFVRVVVPLADRDGSIGEATLRYPRALPSADDVARGWRTQVRDLARVIVPDPRLQAVLDAALPALLAAPLPALADGGRTMWDPTRAPRWDHVAALAGLHDRAGLHDDAATLLARAVAHRMELPDEAAGDDTWLVDACAAHLARVADPDLARAVAECTTRIVAPVSGRRPHTASGSAVAPVRAVAVLEAASTVLAAAGERRAAAASRAAASTRAVQADATSADTGPLDVVQRAMVAGAALASGDASAAWRTLDTLLDVVSPTGAWPASPAAGGDRHCLAATAAVAALGLDLFAHAGSAPGSVHLLVQVPEGWLGGRIEAHQVSCDVGSVSFAVRWHDDRPALLWEVETVGVDEGGITLDASGLDPSWRGTGSRGEALLAPVHMPESSATRGSVIKGLQIGRADRPGRRP